METLRTTRLILRPWTLADAPALYAQAQNPKIGAMCGWLPHKSVAESREIIEHILLKPHSFAICLADNQLIGSIGLLFPNDSNLPLAAGEAEIGYWLGESFWRKGYATEAMQAMIAYSFEKLRLSRLLAGAYQENIPSQKVLKKCGFRHQQTIEHFFSKPTGETHIALLYILAAPHFQVASIAQQRNPMSHQPPQQIRLQADRQGLVLVYPDAEYTLPAEYLRVYSPSAEVRGHGRGQAKLQTGKAGISITDLQPAGNYALKITFSDGHDSGLYSWGYLYELASGYATMWPDYLSRLEAVGASRNPAAQVNTTIKGKKCPY